MKMMNKIISENNSYYLDDIMNIKNIDGHIAEHNPSINSNFQKILQLNKKKLNPNIFIQTIYEPKKLYSLATESEIIDKKPINIYDIYSKINEDWENWSKFIRDSLDENINYFIGKSNNFLYLKNLNNREIFFFDKIKISIIEEIKDNEIDINQINIDLLKDSIYQIVRYTPALSREKITYLDFNLSDYSFSLSIKKTNSKKGTITIKFKNKDEILFSYSRKMKSLFEISGYSYIGDDLSDSCAIKSILNTMDF